MILQRISEMALQAGPHSTHVQLLAGALALVLVLYALLREQGTLYPGIPAFGVDEKGWMRIEKSRKRYTERGLQLVGEAIRKVEEPAIMPC